MPLITQEKVQKLIYILKQENSRSLFLSCLPGDFKRTRTKLDLARLDEYQLGFSQRLLAALKSGDNVNYRPTEVDFESAVNQAVITKKLVSLLDQSRTHEREKGSNPLKIGFPILVQENRTATSNCYAAPLFIWDIEMKPGHNNTWIISAAKDAPSKNYSLEGLVEGDGTQVNLSALYDRFTDGQPLDAFMDEFPEAVRGFIEDNPHIQTSFDPALNGSLDVIPYTKKADLVTDESTPFRLSLINGALLGKFVEGKISIIRDLATCEQGLEDLADGGVSTASLGANRLDPSQASAIIDINQGKHLVLHGPPGTGKSQSITALVTAAVAQNLRVAVVCQKMAALDVIESNLKELRITSGIAKITNPIKDRRAIIDQARDRAESNQACGGNQSFHLLTESEYQSLSVELNKAKKAAQETLIPPGHTFKEAVARIMQIEREVGAEGIAALVQKKPNSSQLSFWATNLNQTVHGTGHLIKRFQEIKPILHLRNYFNNQVGAAQVGNDLIALQELRNKLQDIRAAQKKKQNEILDKAQFLQTTEKEHQAWLETKVADLRSTLAALPRELYASELPMALLLQPQQSENRPLNSVHELVSQSFDCINELEQRKFNLSRNQDCEAMRSASSISRTLRILFNKKARSVWAEWSKLEGEISNAGLNVADDLTAMRDALGEARVTLGTAIKEHREGLPVLGTLALINALNTRKGHIERLTRILNDEDGKERLDEAPEKYEALEKLERRKNEVCNKIDGISWLTAQGAEGVKGEGGEQVLQDLQAHATVLSLLKDWLVDIKELRLKLSDLEFGHCLAWVEYHTIRHIIETWSDMDLLLQRNSKIHQIKAEVKKLQSIVNKACINAICAQFKVGVTRIERHPTVHSFRQEFAKTGRNRKSLRKLYHRHPLEMTQLFPIHLTTPEAVCNLFEGRDECFDLLIFDEASQVELQDSATCLLKGTSIVVAGDEHQMPPSQYFKVSTEHLYEEDEDDEYTGADIEVESLLEFCQQQPHFNSRFLDFHYRSQHPYLIQFSNRAIYSRLVVRPSTLTYKPIQLLDVQGTWENQHNLDEIDEIIRTLREIDIPEHEPPKVMIATFNVRQRTEIIRAIEEAKVDQVFRDHIIPLEEAGLNVKNLENLQGDECDILIISIGYGRTPAGRFVQNYSLINRKNGYRLLNVLVTRARYKVIVLNSIPREYHNQFEQELISGAQGQQGQWSRGLLYAYIQYAQAVSTGDEVRIKRILDILQANSLKDEARQLPSVEALESPFEDEVRNILREQYEASEITLQQPAMGFRIDMVVTPHSHPGLKIAIECDGEAYHSGWENQLADFHRENLLKGAGYKFVRIWSRNWWQDTPGAARHLFQEIKQIKEGWAIREVNLPDWISQEIEFETTNDNPVIVEQEEEVPSHSLGQQPEGASTPEPRVPDNSNPTSDFYTPTHTAEGRKLTREERQAANKAKWAAEQASDKPIITPDHVLAPCLVTARRNNEEATEIRYLFLSSRINSFRGRTRNQWQEFGRQSQNMATFGEEHEVYKAFKGKEIEDIVTFRDNEFIIVDLGFDD